MDIPFESNHKGEGSGSILNGSSSERGEKVALSI